MLRAFAYANAPFQHFALDKPSEMAYYVFSG